MIRSCACCREPAQQSRKPVLWISPVLLVLCVLMATSSVEAQQMCRAGVPTSTPAADFTDNGDGTITHDRTGLMWKRCLEGLSGPECTTGSAINPTWQAALQHADSHSFAGYNNWRLPNIKELGSILELSCWGPAINLAIFPLTDGGSYIWSSSPSAEGLVDAWAMATDLGTLFRSSREANYNVWLVRNSLRGFTDWNFIDLNSRVTSGLLDQTTVTFSWTMEGAVTANWFDQNLYLFSKAVFTPGLDATDGFEFRARKLPDPTPTYTITFSAPVLNPVLHIASNASTLTFIGATPTRVSGDQRLSVTGNQVNGSDYNSPNGTDGNGTVKFWGVFTSLTFTAQYSGTGPEDGIVLQVGAP